MINHAIAYVDVFMRVSEDGERPELALIYQNIDQFSSQEIVRILSESVQRKKFYGSDVVLKEMKSDEFKEYVRRKFAPMRNLQLSA